MTISDPSVVALYAALVFILGFGACDLLASSMDDEANKKWHLQKYAYVRFLIWGGLLALIAIALVAMKDVTLAAVLLVGLLIVIIGVVMRLRRRTTS